MQRDKSLRKTIYISISGPLATGKTSLTKLLSETFSWAPIYENLSLNPYFEDFYQDNKRWCFHFVISFLVNALEMQASIAKDLETMSICQDWSFLEHHEIYGKHVLDQGIISQRDFDICERLHSQIMANVVVPNLLIVLDAEPKTILKRVMQRRREGEAGKIPEDYVSALRKKYLTWDPSLNIPVLRINTDKCNFISNKNDKEFVIDQVRQLLER